MPRPTSGRRRGGQPGNQNRYLHGIYSKQISAEDDVELESMSRDSTEHELALARIRLKCCIEKQSSAPPQDWIKYERAIACYLRLITSLVQNNAANREGNKEALLTVMDFFHQANIDQHVVLD